MNFFFQNPSISAYSSMIGNMTNTKNSGSVMASNWGGSINMASLPSWSHSMVAENVLYTRHFLLVNPDAVNSHGAVDLSVASQNPMKIPMDLSAAIQQADAVSNNPSSSSVVTAATATSSTRAVPTTSSTPSVSSTPKASNGAIGVSSPQIVVSLLSVVVAFLFL